MDNIINDVNQNDFSNIAISNELKHAISDMGYDEATSIQTQSIPLILEGRDIIGLSQTGSGKTAAFGLPAIELVDTSISSKIVQVLILCPTRELANQACNEVKKYSKYIKEVDVTAIFGGDSIERQMIRLRQGCQIVVGTPGRIMDHMRRRTLKLDNVKLVVLDEADEMLDMGFLEDIETILTATPQERQTALFSATMSSEVLKITKQFLKDPQMVEIKQPQRTVSTVEQCYYNVPRGKKNAALYRLLEYYKPTSSIIFCNTKKMVDELIVELRNNGYPAQGLHGDMRQAARTQVMNQFKEEKFNILVATDVAARGIDVNDVKIVFNYDLPQEDEYYVHRIGRTGRAGKSGKAFTLIQGNRQLSQLKNIMRYTKCEITPKLLPTVAEIKKFKSDELSSKILSFMDDNDYSAYASAIEELTAEKYTANDVAAALFAMTIMQNSSSGEVFEDFDDASLTDYRVEESSSRAKRAPIKQISGKRKEYNNENMVSVKISIGRKENVSPKHILGAVAGETGLQGKLFGAITIQSTFSTIDVPKEYKDLVIKSINKTKIKGKTVTVS